MGRTEGRITKKGKDRKPRKCLTLGEKLEIISSREKGVTGASLAEKWKVDPSTITKILHEKEKLLSLQSKRSATTTKKVSKEKYEKVNKATLLWFNSARAAHVPISGPIIQQQAMHFANKFEITDFNASRGWLDKFLKRNKLVVHQMKGEQLSANSKDAIEFKQELKQLILENGYDDEDLYNGDETGMNFFLKLETCAKFLYFRIDVQINSSSNVRSERQRDERV